MVKVRLPNSVEVEIETIGTYIAEHDSVAAVRVMQSLYQRCISLETMPYRGSEFRDDYRRIFEGTYQILYRVEEIDNETIVYIVTVHHMSRRDPDLV